MLRMITLTSFAAMLMAGLARADDNALIAQVKASRAQNGETIERIIAKASKVAHFIPRGWEVGQKDKDVIFSWARHSTDKEGDEFSIIWSVAPDGRITLDRYAKPIELGWQAFALWLIVEEMDAGEPDANQQFVRDLTNFDFVETKQGKLGN